MAGGMFTTADSSVLPEDVLLRKKYAQSLLGQSTDTSPVGHPLAAVARALQGLVGGSVAYNANQEQKTEQQKAMDALMRAYTGQATANPGVPDAGGTVAPQPMPSTMPQPASVTPGAPDRIYSENEVSPLDPVASKPLGLRNNNPLNIEAGPFAQNQPGFVSANGRFANFADTNSGMGAASNLLDQYAKRGLNTVSGIVSKWAPAGDGNNNPAMYAATVAREMGIDPNQPLDLSNPQVKSALIAAMAGVENGQKMPPQQVAQVLSPSPATSQAPAVQGGVPAGTMGVLRAATNPWLGSAGQAVAGKILEKQLTPKDQWVTQVGPDGVPIQVNKTTGEQKAAPRDAAIGEVEYARTNWQKLGFPDPNSQDPKAQNFWKEYNAKRLGGAGVNVAIDQRASSKFEDTIGEGMGKRAIAALEDGDKAQSDINNIRLARSLLQGVNTGAFANTSATIGSVMQGMHLDPEKFGLDPKLPATQQAMQSLVNSLTLGKIGAATGGMPANNFSDADRSFLTKIMPSLANRPEANDIILDAAERVAQIRQDKAIAWADARAGQWDQKPGEKMSYEDFDRTWRKQNAGRNIFADLTQKIQAIGGGPQPGTDGWMDMGNGVRIREKK